MDLVLWGRVKYLSLFLDIIPRWILWKKSREDWSLWASRVAHCSSSSILPTLLVLRHLLQVQLAAVLCTLSTCWIWVLQYGLQIGAAYSSLGRNKDLYASSLVLLGAKAKFLRRKHIVLLLWTKYQRNVDPSPCSLWLLYQYILRSERFPKFADAECTYEWFVCVSIAASLSKSDIWHHWTSFPFGLPEPKTVKIFLQNETVLQWMNVPIQDTIVRKQANWRLDIIGRSFIKIRKRISPRTDPRGTQYKTETGSEAWPSKTTCWLRPESHELIHLWVNPLIP